MVIKNVSKPNPNAPAQVSIDGKVFNFQTLNQVLQQAAAAQPDTEYSVTVNPVAPAQ